ncbi:Diguanylate cyclase (GGDEF) domain-containing protein [Candidatus Electronema halotolerans]
MRTDHGMRERKPGSGDSGTLSGKDVFTTDGMTAHEKSSPIYSLLSGQRVGQIPIDEHNEIDREERTVHQKILSVLQWGLLLLVALCTALPCVQVAQPTVLLAALAVCAAVFTGMHFIRPKAQGSRWLLELDTWAVLALTTVTVWQTGLLSSPFLPLYFVAIMLTSAVLDAKATFQQTSAVTVCWLLLAAADRKAFSGTLEALRVNAEYLVVPLIRLILLWMLAWTVSRFSEENEIIKEKIRQLSRTDQLTGLWNMKMLLIFMQREYQRTLTRSGTFSVLMIDADSLKAVNDNLGHHAGTMLIVSISETMRSELREEDMIARFGGDEFIAFLPETGCQDAFTVAERLRSRIAATPLLYEGHNVEITVSCGIACFPDHGDDLTEVMKMADRALYRSKDEGKNKCTVFDPGSDKDRWRFG